MKTYHAILMVPMQYRIYGEDIKSAAETARVELEQYLPAVHPDGELATPFILSIVEIDEDGKQIHTDQPADGPGLSSLEPGRHQPYFQPDDPGPRAA